MHRFWNLKTQFVAVLVALLLGALLLQNYVHELNKDRLLVKVENTAQRIADEVTRRLRFSVGLDLTIAPVAGGRTNERARRIRPSTPRDRGTIRIEMPELRRHVESMLMSLNAKERELRNAHLLVVRFMNSQLRPETSNLEEFEANPQLPPVFLLHSTTRRPQVLFDSTTAGTRTAEGDGEVSGLPGGGSILSADLAALPLGDPGATDIDITEYLDEVQAVFDEYRNIDLLATVGIFICGIAAALFLSFRITRPVYQVVEAFERVADGNLETRVDEHNPGEFAVLATQFNRMVESLEENRQLERELAQRERVLHMGDLAAGVAHDVRNPLNAIHLNIGQIRDEFVPDDDKSRERFLRFTSDVQREVVRLNQLVSNFLSLAQPSAASTELVDPNGLLRELVRLLRKEATDRNVVLNIDLETDLPTLGWDRQEMMSAFLNIAMNALQAMEPAGGSLSIISGLREEADSEVIALTFVDTGKGISRQDLERVFVPYYTTRRGGTGLGMAIARRIAERNGGRLQLESREGEGTSVAFVFPVGSVDDRSGIGVIT